MSQTQPLPTTSPSLSSETPFFSNITYVSIIAILASLVVILLLVIISMTAVIIWIVRRKKKHLHHPTTHSQDTMDDIYDDTINPAPLGHFATLNETVENGDSNNDLRENRPPLLSASSDSSLIEPTRGQSSLPMHAHAVIANVRVQSVLPLLKYNKTPSTNNINNGLSSMHDISNSNSNIIMQKELVPIAC